MTAKLEDLAKHRQARERRATRHAGARKPPSAGRQAAKRGCPICGQPSVRRFRPFCSGRCADIDLGRWLNESYKVPAEEAEPPGSSEPVDED